MDEVGSVGDDLVRRRVLQAGVEKVDFKSAGGFEDAFPSIHTTFGRDVLVDELC